MSHFFVEGKTEVMQLSAVYRFGDTYDYIKANQLFEATQSMLGRPVNASVPNNKGLRPRPTMTQSVRSQ